VRGLLEAYAPVTDHVLRRHFHDFLEQVAPVAQDLRVRLCCHPDDPPFGLLGLPRIMSTEADYAETRRRRRSAGERDHAVLGFIGARGRIMICPA
jgi:mannonate dehydratase